MIRINLGVYAVDLAIIIQNYHKTAKRYPQRHDKYVRSTICLRKVKGLGGDNLRIVWLNIQEKKKNGSK